MRYVLRADASQTAGSGHVMRSSAIAEELIARGEDVIFLGQISDLPWVKERIETLGFSVIQSNPSKFISNPKSDVLILDSYEISIDNTTIDPKNWSHVIVIADELTPNYQCCLRIYPSLHSDWGQDLNVPILAGPKYIPIRSSLSENTRQIDKKQNKFEIIVVAGGSDHYGLVHEIAKILALFPEDFNAYLFANSKFNTSFDNRFQYIQIGIELENFISTADLVLTTSSTSSLEFIAGGLCVGVACGVNNQLQNYDSLGNLGLAAQIGSRISSVGWVLDKEMIHRLIISKELRRSIKERAKGFIDFKGASRIVDAMKSL